MDRHGVLKHHVVSGVPLSKAALLFRDVVLQVPQVHAASWLPIEVGGHPIHLPPWNYLNHHRLSWEKDLVGEADAMDN